MYRTRPERPPCSPPTLLLRQPGGFEGSGFRRVFAIARDLAVLDCDHAVDRHLDLCSAVLASPRRDESDDHLVPGIEILGRPHEELVERLEPLLECPHGLVATAVRHGFGVIFYQGDIDV